MGRDRALAIVVAIALHAGVIALALSLPRQARPAIAAAAPDLPVQFWRIPPAAATPAARPGRHRGQPAAIAPPAAELIVPEREIIDQGHGVTMTIQGGSSADAGVEEAGDSARRGPPHAGERWLRFEVWVPSVATAPRPSDYCVPRKPEMPEEAADLGITGRFEVSYDVDAEGVVSGVAVEAGAPSILSRAVRSWLKGCLFEPATQDGRRAPARVKQTFVFRIQ